MSFPHPTVLEGRAVRLEPLEEAHVAPLMAIATAHPDEYALTSTPVDGVQAEAYFRTAFGERAAGRAYPFVVLDAEGGEVLGSSRFADANWRHRHAELGYTWFTPDAFGRGVNLESKYLMLGHAFERVGLHRVQIHTDLENRRSQRAIQRIGASYEGILRHHMVRKDGSVRDTVVFSVIAPEWPRVRAHLELRLREAGLR